MSIEVPQTGSNVLFLQSREFVMRSIVLVLVILLAETSLSFAQGHMGTPQEQQACRQMRTLLPTATGR